VDEANTGFANERFERFLKRGVEAPPPAKGSLFEGHEIFVVTEGVIQRIKTLSVS
jgi:hypothetical protein